MSLIRWYRPGRRMPTVWDQMEHVAREMQRYMPWAEEGEGQQMGIPVDVYENDDEVVVKAEMPGIKKEDIEVNLQDNVLTIRGQTKCEEEVKEEGYYRKELRTGSFYRAITLPSEVKADEITATCDNGVCTIKAPKAKEAKVGKKIEVQ
jgi:HSP20 family protein